MVQGEGLDDVDDSTQAAEASNLDSRGPRDSVDSVSLGGGIGGLAGRLPGKRISFDDERESKDSGGVGGTADGAPPVGPRPLAGPTHSAEVAPRASVGDDRSVRSGGSRVEDDSLGPGTGTGPARPYCEAPAAGPATRARDRDRTGPPARRVSCGRLHHL